MSSVFRIIIDPKSLYLIKIQKVQTGKNCESVKWAGGWVISGFGTRS